MSANYMYSNNVLPSLLPHQQVPNQRSRSASASNAGLTVGSHFQSSFSQPYQQVPSIDAWAHAQQGLYVNSLNKLVNIYPGQNIPDTEQVPVTQNSEVRFVENFIVHGT